MDPNITIRTLRPEPDMPAMAGFLNQTYQAEWTPDEARQKITWPGMDLARDRYVAVLGESTATPTAIIGSAMLFPQSALRFFVQASVLPEFRRQGIGRALIEQVTAEAARRGARQVTGSARWNNEAARGFAAACGFRPAGEMRFFTAPAELDLPAPDLPPGFAIRGLAEYGSPQVFADACNRCYRDMFGHYENHVPVTVEKLSEWHQWDGPSAGGMLVLFAPDGSPAGVALAKAGEGAGVIDSPGVAPEWRHLGLQRPLVLAAARWLKQQNPAPYRIETWGDTPEAVKIYEALGFALDEDTHSVEFAMEMGE